MFHAGMLAVGLVLQQAPPPPAHCKLIHAEGRWQGACTEFWGEKPALRLSAAATLASGRYQKGVDPSAIYAGEMTIPAGTVAIELEVYSDGRGILRPEGLNWITVTDLVTLPETLAFDLNPAVPVPPSDLDRDIIIRAASILSSESVWDRADDRQCRAEDTTWSIYCSMIRATFEVTGGIHHRRPAMEIVRQIVDTRSAGRQYQHRLRDYNNDPSTTLADIRSLFEESLARLKR